MKKICLTLTLLITVFACKQNDPEVKTVEVATQNTTSSTKENPYKDYAKAEFEIKGMTCAMGCAKTIEKKIAKLDGVHFVYVDFEKELAMVEFDDKKLNNDDFLSTVTKVSDTYKVGEINTVDVFTKDLKKKTCDKDCKMACCNGKETEAKTACQKDCKKACCSKSAKV